MVLFSKMNHEDIALIYSMFPVMEKIIHERVGLIGEFRILANNHSVYKHVIRLTVMRSDFGCFDSLDTAGMLLYIGRKANGEIREKLECFDYSPDFRFNRNRQLECRVIHYFNNWWNSIEFDAKYKAKDFVNKIRLDLIAHIGAKEIQSGLICE